MLLRLACTTCSEEVQAGLVDGRLPWVLLGLAVPFVVAWALAAWAAGRLA